MNESQSRVDSKVSVFIGTSLDGFIARINGDLDGMQGVESDGATLECQDLSRYIFR